MLLPFLGSVLLVAAGGLAYSGTFSNGWTDYDDPDYVTKNDHVREGLTASGWRWAWTTFDASNWHPLTWLSHMLDVESFGPDSAVGPHGVNLALHLVSAVLLFFLLARGTNIPAASFVAALIFTLHPAQVEVVAWVSQRKTLLATVLLLASLIAYSSYVRRSSKLWYALSLLLCAACLLAKPIGVVLPILYFLWDGWPARRWPATVRWSEWRPLLWDKLPFVALALGSSVMTILAQQGAIASDDSLPLSVRAGTASVAVFAYLQLAFWPVDLAVFYPHSLTMPPANELTLAAFGLVAITLAVLLQRNVRRYLLFGWFWFLAALVPTIGLVQVGGHFIADRYFYLPSIGVFIAVVWAADDFSRRFFGHRRALWGTAVVLAVALGAMTHSQVAVWRDSESLFTHAARHTKDNYIAYSHLAALQLEQGNESQALTLMQQAYDAGYREVTMLLSLASVRARNGAWDAAESVAREAVARRPKSANAHAKLAEILLGQGKVEEARREVESALALESDHPLGRRLRRLLAQPDG